MPGRRNVPVAPKARESFGPRARNAHSLRNRPTVDQESSWQPPPQVPPRRRAKISPQCSKSRSPRAALPEGTVVKGKVVGIEKDLAVIDVGAKTEGRVALREFAGPGRQSDIKIGDTVEVYLERIENALGEAVLSRDKARREESWGKLEKAFQGNEKVTGIIFEPGEGRLHRRSRRRGGVPAALARSTSVRSATSAR